MLKLLFTFGLLIVGALSLSAEFENNGTVSGEGPELVLITRDEWLAQPQTNVLSDLDLPVNRVIIGHTATENCTTQARCSFITRILQKLHMESRGWDDIGYNFIVGGDGAAYEGRGWNKEGAHTKGYNKGSIGIAFIGTFTSYSPSQQQIDTALLLLEQGFRLGKLTNDYKVHGQKQFALVDSPGIKLWEIIQKWSHFSETIDN